MDKFKKADSAKLFWIVILGIVLYVILDVIAQALPPHYSPISQAESDLAVGKFGLIMTVNFLNRGVLSLLFIFAFLQTLDVNKVAKLPFRNGVYLLSVWAIGALLLAIFPTDVPSTPVSWHGAIRARARTFLIMHMKAVRSLREMTRILNTDQRIRRLCLIKDSQKGYTRSVLSRFSKRVGEENLNKIIDHKVVKLLKGQHNCEVDVVLDASFIKAWSIRHPTDNQTGYSDADARVGRSGRFFALGYKLHLSIDHKTMLPLSNGFASANQNEKKHSLAILDKAKRILQRCKAKVRSVVADSQYSGSKLRDAVEKATIPYPANHMKGVEGLLRVDRKFRTYGSDEQRKEYHKRPLIEAVNSFLKTQFSMANNKVRGLKQVAFYALCSILCLVLNREAAQDIGKHEKAVSPTYFNT